MRIGVISSQVLPSPVTGYAGLEMVAWHCAKELAAKGHQVVLFAPEGSFCPGGQVFYTGKPGQWDEKTAFDKYWNAVLAQNFDAIIDHSWQKHLMSLRMENWPLNPTLKCPLLSVLHAPVNTMLTELPHPDFKYTFVCISEDQGAHFRALFNRDCRVCYNGVDLDYYKPLGLPRSKRFLFLARFSTIKGPDIAIEACKKLGVGLDVIGDTTITNEPELYRRCMAMADGKQIRVIGNQNRGTCVWWYSQAYCLLHPNMRFREPFGLAPVEAMACGCPVIAFDNGAMRETITTSGDSVPVGGGVTGYLAKDREHFESLVKTMAGLEISEPENPDYGIRAHCCFNATRFSVQASADRYEELCREAIRTGGW